MAKKNRFFNRFRLVYRSSPLLLKCIVLATIVFSIAALSVIRMDLNQWQEKTNENRVYAAQLEQENANRKDMIRNQDTVDGVRQIAEEELNLVDPDTAFFHIVTNQD